MEGSREYRPPSYAMDSRHSRASSHTLVGESYPMHDRRVSDGTTYTVVSQNAKVGYIPYDYGERALAYLGLLGTLVVGITLLVISVILYLKFHSPFNSVNPNFNSTGVVYVQMSQGVRTGLDLAFNILVTLCTESTGFVHSTTLKWCLAQEGRLKFSANLRLIRASGCWLAPNGIILNLIHAGLLTLSYASASLVFVPLYQGQTVGQPISSRAPGPQNSGIITLSYIPIATLGVAFICQALISLLGIIGTKIPTWSTSIFDVSAAALSNNYIHYTPGRCMRSLDDQSSKIDPVMPSRLQTSPFHANNVVRRIVWGLWVLPPLVLLWGSIVWILLRSSLIDYKKYNYGKPSAGLIPSLDSSGTYTTLHLDIALGNGSIAGWLYVIPVIAFFQSFLTMGLHCCELIVIMIRDEKQWRSARRRKGARLRSNPLFILFTSWRSFALFVIKPVLHWLFGNSISWQPRLGLVMFPIQILYFCLALLLFATFITLTARAPIHGRQPVAYGHLQTMVNLIDDWSRSPDGRRIFWGHKVHYSDGVCHAGTSGKASEVSEVFLDALYAGCGVELRKRVAHAESISQELPEL